MNNTKLKTHSESELMIQLKRIYSESIEISKEDKRVLQESLTTNYALLGMIGLILKDKARILLGKKQVYDSEVKTWCMAIETTNDDLEEIADKYLNDEFNDVEEFIFRKVMLEYPANE